MIDFIKDIFHRYPLWLIISVVAYWIFIAGFIYAVVTGKFKNDDWW